MPVRISSAIFGDHTQKALKTAGEILRALQDATSGGQANASLFVIVCDHFTQRDAVLGFLREQSQEKFSLNEIDLHSALGNTRDFVDFVRNKVNGGPSEVISLHGIERSHWKYVAEKGVDEDDASGTLDAWFSELLKGLGGPLLLWLTEFSFNKVKEHSNGVADQTEQTFVFHKEGALWAADAASALSLVEENVFSQSKKQRETWRNLFDQMIRGGTLEKSSPISQRFRTLVAYQRKGIALCTLSKLKQARDCLRTARDGFRKEEEDDQWQLELARSCYYLGTVYDGFGEHKTAMTAYKNGLRAAENSNCDFTKYYLIHQIESRGKDLEQKQKYFETQLQKVKHDYKFRRSQIYEEIAHLNYHLGVVYQDKGDYEKALKHYLASKEGLPIWNRAWRADLLHQMGSVKFAQGAYVDAERLYQDSLILMETELQFDVGASVVRRSLAALYSLQEHREEEAREHLNRVREIREDAGLSAALPMDDSGDEIIAEDPGPATSEPPPAPQGSTRYLDEDPFDSVYGAAIELDFANKETLRDLLSSLPPHYQSTFKYHGMDNQILARHLNRLNRDGPLENGRIPFRSWLRNAKKLAGGRPQAEVFEDALKLLPDDPEPDK